jgi:hypothetical protein
VPLTRRWPWSHLSSEVTAAAERWSAATAAAALLADRKENNPPSSDAEATGKVEEVGVVVVTSTREQQRLTPPATRDVGGAAEGPRPPRKPRKVRQRCPLCLGPAFKWMLVSVPPVEELCAQLSVAYPALEDTLKALTQLPATEPAGCSPARSSALVSRPHTQGSEEAAQELGKRTAEEEAHQKQLPSIVARAAQFTTAAFTPSPAASTVCHRGGHLDRGGSDDSNSDEDEEAVRRRRRSSGGSRKGITFADEVRVTTRPPHQVAAEHASLRHPPPAASPLSAAERREVEALPRLSTLPNIADTRSTSEQKGGDLSGTTALPSGDGGSREDFVCVSSTSAALQLSVDLIPSPDMSTAAPVAAVVRSGGNYNATLDVLSSSQQEQQDHMNASPLNPSGVLGQSPTVDQQVAEDEGSVRNALQSRHTTAAPAPPPPLYAKVIPASQIPYLSETLDDDVDDEGGGSSTEARQCPHRAHTRGTATRNVMETAVNGAGCILLDTSSLSAGSIAQLLASLPQKSRAPTASLSLSPAPRYGCCVHDRTDTSAAESPTAATPYSSVRGFSGVCSYAHLLDNFAKEQSAELSERKEGGAAVMSVDPRDVWALDVAYLQRHPLLPNCCVTLRAGRLTWCDGQEDLIPARDSNTKLPLVCVVGRYMGVSAAVDHGSDAGGARSFLALSPAVCIAAVLGVPCVDIESFLSSQRYTWRSHAAAVVASCGRQLSAAERTKSPPPPPSSSETHSSLFQAFRTGGNFLSRCTTVSGTPTDARHGHFATTTSSSSSTFSSSRGPAGSWMADTRRLLLSKTLLKQNCLLSSCMASNTPSQCGQRVCCYFFPLPDGAVWHLVAALLERGGAARHRNRRDATANGTADVCQYTSSRERGQEEEEEQSTHGTPPQPFVSRKRGRGNTAQEGTWDTTDGHPQRAWRRLILACGGAVLEISVPLFAAITAAALESVPGEVSHTGDDASCDTAVALLARHSCLLAPSASLRSWLHVDIDEGSPGAVPASSRRAANDTTMLANADNASSVQQTVFLLYSPAAIRKAYEARTSADPTRPSSALPEVSKSDLFDEQQFLLLFQTVLDHIAALIAYVLSPLLPAARQTTSTVGRDVRPASWLLASIAEGCNSPGCHEWKESHKARREEPQSSDDLVREGVAGESRRGEQGAPLEQVEQSMLGCMEATQATADSAAGPDVATTPFLTRSPLALPLEVPQAESQRVGVYRSLLYADTP